MTYPSPLAFDEIGERQFSKNEVMILSGLRQVTHAVRRCKVSPGRNAVHCVKLKEDAPVAIERLYPVNGAYCECRT